MSDNFEKRRLIKIQYLATSKVKHSERREKDIWKKVDDQEPYFSFYIFLSGSGRGG